MKQVAFKLWFIPVLLIATTAIWAQDARKEYHDEFDVNKGALLLTDTRYTNVEVIAWDKNTIDVFAEVKVNASSKSKADALLEKINVEISQSGKQVKVFTRMEGIRTGKIKVEIDVIIKAPAWVDMSMDAAYGNIFIQEATSHVDIKLQYGNLKAGNLARSNEKPYNNLKLRYSNADIDMVAWLNLDLAYSDVNIPVSKMLYVDNRYSKVIGDHAGGIVADGVYDKYYFDEVDSFVGELKYSGVKFGKLNKKLNVHASYTPVKIGELAPGFEVVDLSLSYGNCNLGIHPDASFKLEAESKYGRINTPYTGLSKVKEDNSTRVWGSIGSGSKGILKIITRYGNANIE